MAMSQFHDDLQKMSNLDLFGDASSAFHYQNQSSVSLLTHRFPTGVIAPRRPYISCDTAWLSFYKKCARENLKHWKAAGLRLQKRVLFEVLKLAWKGDQWPGPPICPFMATKVWRMYAHAYAIFCRCTCLLREYSRSDRVSYFTNVCHNMQYAKAGGDAREFHRARKALGFNNPGRATST